jgi:uncharacterized low-complexity protein
MNDNTFDKLGLGAALAAFVAMASPQGAFADLVSSESLQGGYEQASLASSGAPIDEKGDKEGKCGEGKCGKDKKKGEKQGHCGDAKHDKKKGDKEGKCGEGKCGEK